MPEDDNNGKTMIERHIQTLMVAGTMALLSWVLLNVLDVRDRLIKFEERLATLQAQVNTGIDDRFRKSDWLREKERLDERFHALRLQVERNTTDIDKLDREHDRLPGVRKPK